MQASARGVSLRLAAAVGETHSDHPRAHDCDGLCDREAALCELPRQGWHRQLRDAAGSWLSHECMYALYGTMCAGGGAGVLGAACVQFKS